MTVTLIVLSRADDDGRPLRRAQLDLLLRSRAKFWPEARLRVIDQPAGEPFGWAVRDALRSATDLVAFATDDGAFTERVNDPYVHAMMDLPAVLTVSLRLGWATRWCYPTGFTHEPTRYWPDGTGDFGYPGSVDAHVFRRGDLFEMLPGDMPTNPTTLEVVLDSACRELFRVERPLMEWADRPSYTAVPVNRVSSQSNVRSGTVFPQSVEALNARFDAGDRIDLEATFRDAVIDAAHVELPYRWESERAA